MRINTRKVSDFSDIHVTGPEINPEATLSFHGWSPITNSAMQLSPL